MGWLENCMSSGVLPIDQAQRFVNEVRKHSDKVDLIFTIASSQVYLFRARRKARKGQRRDECIEKLGEGEEARSLCIK